MIRTIGCYVLLLGICFVQCYNAPEARAAEAVNPETRAAALQKARAQCNDPDVDIRAAYIEEAISSGDETKKRICLKLALSSDNTDIKNLGLRTAISSLEQIAFVPKQENNAMSDEKKDDQAVQFANAISSGLILEKVSQKGSVIWYSKVHNTKFDEHFAGKLSLNGSQAAWSGRVKYGTYSTTECVCSITASLKESGKLEGSLSCGDRGTYEVTAEFF